MLYTQPHRKTKALCIIGEIAFIIPMQEGPYQLTPGKIATEIITTVVVFLALYLLSIVLAGSMPGAWGSVAVFVVWAGSAIRFYFYRKLRLPLALTLIGSVITFITMAHIVFFPPSNEVTTFAETATRAAADRAAEKPNDLDFLFLSVYMMLFGIAFSAWATWLDLRNPGHRKGFTYALVLHSIGAVLVVNAVYLAALNIVVYSVDEIAAWHFDILDYLIFLGAAIVCSLPAVLLNRRIYILIQLGYWGMLLAHGWLQTIVVDSVAESSETGVFTAFMGVLLFGGYITIFAVFLIFVCGLIFLFSPAWPITRKAVLARLLQPHWIDKLPH